MRSAADVWAGNGRISFVGSWHVNGIKLQKPGASPLVCRRCPAVVALVLLLACPCPRAATGNAPLGVRCQRPCLLHSGYQSRRNDLFRRRHEHDRLVSKRWRSVEIRGYSGRLLLPHAHSRWIDSVRLPGQEALLPGPGRQTQMDIPHGVIGFTHRPPSIADGVIYIGSDDGFLYAVNPNGSVKWEIPNRRLYPLFPGNRGGWNHLLRLLGPPFLCRESGRKTEMVL